MIEHLNKLMFWNPINAIKIRLSLCFSWTEYHAMKASWGSRGIAPHILDFGTRWRWVASFTPRPLYSQGKTPWYPLDRTLGGPQSRSGYGGKDKNSQPLPGLEPPIMKTVVQRYTIELSRLFYKCNIIIIIIIIIILTYFTKTQVSRRKTQQLY
jgi:hypothetical protein